MRPPWLDEDWLTEGLINENFIWSRNNAVSTSDKLSASRNRALVIDAGIWGGNLGIRQIDKTTGTNEDTYFLNRQTSRILSDWRIRAFATFEKRGEFEKRETRETQKPERQIQLRWGK